MTAIVGDAAKLAYYAQSANIHSVQDPDALGKAIDGATKNETDPDKIVSITKKILTKAGVKSSNVKLRLARVTKDGIEFQAAIFHTVPKR